MERGHRIFIIDVNEEGLKHAAQVHLEDYSDRVGWKVCDLNDITAIRTAIDEAAEFFGGRIDHLVNNAGISQPYWPDGKTMEDHSTLELWKAYMDVNLTGTFAMSQAVIPYMKLTKDEDKQKLPDSGVGRSGPCILNVSSFRGLISDSNQEGYAASKGKQLFKTLMFH